MRSKTRIGFRDERRIETLLRNARLVAGDEQYRLAAGIEIVSDPPRAAGRREAKLLHVRVRGAAQGVAVRALQPRLQHFQQFDQGQRFVLHRGIEFEKFHREDRMKLDAPGR